MVGAKARAARAGARPELLDLRPGWGGSDGAETITLQPLSAAESDQLIEGLVAGNGLREETRARIRETAEGKTAVRRAAAGCTRRA